MEFKQGVTITERQMLHVRLYSALDAAYSRMDEHLIPEIRPAFNRLNDATALTEQEAFQIGVLVGKLEALAAFPCDPDTAAQLLKDRGESASNLRQTQYSSLRDVVRHHAKVRWAIDDAAKDTTTGKMAEYIRLQIQDEHPEIQDISDRTIREWIADIGAHLGKNLAGRPRKQHR